ncbi:putative Tic20 family protein [Murinocardiopsis flavida]|uniref:Putative Tic20 family protein n=1 Tax=Murinocardiopsis flavida TaxID=645275 RepID=A0A2P8DQ22_9ACTN|nr:DUF1707 and DUF4870 domain-containing protein [Murinocardiopsis flavida]PSK99326.1 putative Tic20 family protein [Murinocardiopsis flavida]
MAVYNPSRPPNSGGLGRYPPQTPQAQLRITHADRDAAADRLKDAFADGQLDQDEFEERLNTVMAAKVGADLQPVFGDLRVTGEPAAPESRGAPAAAQPTSDERTWAFGGHVSGYFTLALGPLLVLILKGRTSAFIRRQAMEALNYQITMIAATVLMTVAWILVFPVFIYMFMVLGFVFLPMLGGLAALMGFDWRYPFTWRPVRDDPRSAGS